jgi:hypothetical protein
MPTRIRTRLSSAPYDPLDSTPTTSTRAQALQPSHRLLAARSGRIETELVKLPPAVVEGDRMMELAVAIHPSNDNPLNL